MGPHGPVTLQSLLLTHGLTGHFLSTYYVLAQAGCPAGLIAPLAPLEV